MPSYAPKAPPGLDLNPRFDPASIYNPVLQMGYEMSPGYGDVLAGQRALEAYGNMGQSLRDMNLLNAASYGAQGLTEQISTIPVIGDVATLMKGVSGLAGTMIGRKGMARLDPALESQTDLVYKNAWDTVANSSYEDLDLEINQEMWRAMQGYIGPEGQVRFEISDKDAFVDVDAVTPYFTRGELDKVNKLQDVFYHKEFFKAYPDFNPTVVSIRQPGNDVLASYDEVNDTIYLNISTLKDEANETGLDMAQTIKRALLHENQHGVQGLEGFARGGNSTDPLYRKLAGEHEAYMVGSSRADLPLKISKMFPPFNTDMPYAMRTPLDEQVVRVGPGQSNADPKVKAVQDQLMLAKMPSPADVRWNLAKKKYQVREFKDTDTGIKEFGDTKEEALEAYKKKWLDRQYYRNE